MTANPLLDPLPYPPFPSISPKYLEEAFEARLTENQRLIMRLETLSHPTWKSFVGAIDDAEVRLQNIWSLVSAYNAVLNSDEIRSLYERLLERLTQYRTAFWQNKALFDRFEQFARGEEFALCSEAQRESVRHILRDFRLGGIDLPVNKQGEFSVLSKQLSKLKNTFAQNLLDATQSWHYWVNDEQELSGVPDAAKEQMLQAAESKGYESGYLLTLDMPCYQAVISYCESRALRKRVYDAYMTRASDQGDGSAEWDNSRVMEEILACRKRMAQLLGFSSYADYSLESKMATDVAEVTEFLELLADKSYSRAKSEFEELSLFAKSEDGLTEIELWDVAYYSEKLRQARFGYSKEEIRQYFPLPRVLSGLFDLVSTLFAIQIRARDDVPGYHPDVQFYEIQRNGKAIAGFFMDLYARENKRAGAWLANCRSRIVFQDGAEQLPLAFLVCNFSPPKNESQPSLLLPDELRTLFHEFGHCLHYTLTKVDVGNVSGISNVPWDAVELPSQLLENWCWHKEVVQKTSAHAETGEPLPDSLLDAMRNSRTFQSGMLMVRQLEFALFDFMLHRDFEPNKTSILGLLDEVRDQVSVKKQPVYTRFANGFSHIFAGGYAAGYYSYKWAEVLAADAFSRFEEEGVMNPSVGGSLLSEFLELGGSRDVNAMFRAFRGREPRVEPLLQQAGIL